MWRAAALLLVLAGCTTSAPSNSPAPLAASPRTTPGASAVELHWLDPRHVPGGKPASANGEVLWSAGHDAAPELWRYIPGADAPEEIYVSPNADATITDIVAADPGYAFVETSPSAYGEDGWRVWFISGPGAKPVELDRGQAVGSGAPPTIAMDDAHIVWAAFDDTPAGPVSRLRMVRTSDLADPTTLLELPIADALLWSPALNGDELWFAAIHPDPTGTAIADESDIERLSLSDPGGKPAPLRSPAKDFNPVVNDAYLAWKTTSADSAALSWGALHVQDRRTKVIGTVPVEDANRPTLGDRYIAFDEITGARLQVFDPQRGALITLAGSTADPSVRYGGASLSGRLLAFFRQLEGVPPSIGWALLPD